MNSSQIAPILAPYLDRIIKNSSWRKHAAIISSCKSALDLLQSPDPSLPEDALLRPLLLALESASPKLAEPALDALRRLLPLPLPATDPLVAAICASAATGDEPVELAMLRAAVAAARASAVRGDALVRIVKSCYNVCLGSQSAANQFCAKVALAQIAAIVFARAEGAEAGAVDVADLAERGVGDAGVVQAGRDFARDAMGGEGVGEREEEGLEVDLCYREDGFLLFKNLCRFSMKFAAPGESEEDPLLLRGKVLSLELLKMVMENAGTFWLVNER